MSNYSNVARKVQVPNFEHKVVHKERFEIYSEIENKKKDIFAEDVLEGLKSSAKYLLPKYFYNQTGSELFEQITRTKEYYPTRKETEILNKYVPQLIGQCNKINILVELGSGSSLKTKIILNEFFRSKKELRYTPIDVSDILSESGLNLINNYKRLTVSGIISNYERGLTLISQLEDQPKLVIFLGSSIGNFDLLEIHDFFETVRDSIDAHDFFLIGFDLIKEKRILEAAYNDSQGITAKFNLNILKRINEELGGNFNLSHFHHHAFYNEHYNRIEMYLVSEREQHVKIESLDEIIYFKQGETIHTENSYKFNDEMIYNFAKRADFQVQNIWKDPDGLFALSLFKPI
jgi:L-histidine N-alpha-methyltransferase